MPEPTPAAPEPIAQFFEYAHLPEKMQAVSKPFCELAKQVEATLPRNPERSVALRKLLEAKDAAVRAMIFKAPTLLLLALGAVLLAPAVALAQVAAPAPTVAQSIGSLLASLLTPSGIGTLLGIAAVVLGFLGANSAVWKQRVALAVKHAFDLVEDMNTDPALAGKLDKEDAGLKAANDYMVANGWRPLKPGEQAVAVLTFKAMNGQAEAQSAIQAKAMIQAAQAIAPAPAPAAPSPT